jgi:hypothetical protein
MNSFFYVVSSLNSIGDEYSYGITDIPFESFCVGKTVHLFLSCYNQRELLNEILNIDLSGGVILEGTNNIKCDLRKLLKYCIKKIQHLEPSIIIDLSENVDPSKNNTDNVVVDLSENKVNETPPVKDDLDRIKIFEKLNLKIFEETSNVNQILTKVRSFKTNVSKINQTLDSLRRFKSNTGIDPQVVQSERPRAAQVAAQGSIPSIQATPRGGLDILTLEECKIWMKNKTINPRTGRSIDVNGPTYKRIQAMTRMYRLI